MKKSRIIASTLLTAWMLSVMFSFVACSADSDSIIDNNATPKANASENLFSLVVKALSNKEDITTKGDVENVTLYIFDENNDFYQQVNLDKATLLQRKTVQIDCPGSNRITVIAWGGLSNENENISSMNNANVISDLQVQLKQNNGVVTSAASDLFYGKVTMQRSQPTKAIAIETLAISRKVSSLSLSTKGVNKKFGTVEGSYFYKIKKTKSSFNYNGELTGTDVEYIFPAFFDKSGTLIASTTPLFPASEVAIELYRDNEMIFSSENAKNKEKLSASEGEQVNVVFDFTRSSYSVFVANWGTVSQIVTVS